MGNTIQVDHEMDQIIKAHAQVQKRQSIQNILDQEYNEANANHINIVNIDSDMGLSEGTPGQEERYDALNDSANPPPLSQIQLADLVIQRNPNQGRNIGNTQNYFDLKKAQTFSFNAMSTTLKQSELRLKS